MASRGPGSGPEGGARMGRGSSQQAQSWCGGACWSVSCGPCLVPVTAGSAVSNDSDIFSQMTSTSRSKVCLTLMLSLALASKNSNPQMAPGSRPACRKYESSGLESWLCCETLGVSPPLSGHQCPFPSLWVSSLTGYSPRWSASCRPRSDDTTRSSSMSHLFPTSSTWALSHE